MHVERITTRRAVSSFVAHNIGRSYQVTLDRDVNVGEVAALFPDPADQYRYFRHAFWHRMPGWIRSHRDFFRDQARGFGENAFHALWHDLFRDLRPRSFLEIGVYRGQVFSLTKRLAREFHTGTKFRAISPFAPVGDAVSRYGDFDYEADVRQFCTRFGVLVEDGELVRALSNEPDAATAVASCRWDLAYIDGCHDEDVARSDFELVAQNLSDRGLIVMDDAGAHTGYRPGRFSFAGHAGPSAVVRDAVQSGWRIMAQAGHNVVLRRA